MTDQTETARIIRAPWTSEQVAALNAFQERGGMHPFTCGAEAHRVHVVLLAHRDGWHCSDPACDYRQDWAHAFMANPEAWPKFPFGDRHGPTPEEVRAAVSFAVPAPAIDQTVLRDRIAEALMQWAESNNSPQYVKVRRPDTVVQNAYSRADAVMAVLPATVDRAADKVDALVADRAAVLREAIEVARKEGIRLEAEQGVKVARGARSVAYLLRKLLMQLDLGTGTRWDVPDARPGTTDYTLQQRHTQAREARQEPAQDGEAHQPTLRERHRAAWNALTPAEQAARITALDTVDDAAQSGKPETDEEAVVHACPEPGDNGISRCCGRPPCEFVGERVTRDPDKVTCTGHTAAPSV